MTPTAHCPPKGPGRRSACAALLLSALWTPVPAAPVPVSSVAIRAGDPAPVLGRAPSQWGCRLAVDASGGVLFVDRQKTAIVLKDGDEARVVAHVGDRAPGGTLSEVCEAQAAPDGSVVFRALLSDLAGGSPRQGIFRRPAGGGAFETLLASGDTIDLRGGSAVVGALFGPAVDGAGRVVVAADFAGGAAALLRIGAAVLPEILVQTGDPLGGGVFLRSTTAPAAGADGRVVFTAALVSGVELVAALLPGGTPSVLFLATPAPGQPTPSVSVAPPAVNAAGQVAFLWREGGEIKAQRVSGGVSQTIAAPGTAAPRSGTFVEITNLPPALTADGGVVFGASRSDGRRGIFLHRDAPEAVAEEGEDAGGEVFTAFDLHQPQAAPAVAADGSIHFVAADTVGEALFARGGDALRVELRAGQALPLGARFVAFIEPSHPFLGGGPFLAADGRMIFDARLTTGVRGLFLRDREGQLTAVAVTGDPAPGGGHFDGRFFSFHTVGVSGRLAFLAAAPDTPAGAGLVLYYGGGDAGPLQRVIAVGDTLPGSAAKVTGFQPPSRVNGRGEIAVPVFTPDGMVVLLGYDGETLYRVAGPGDALPGGGSVRTVFTGAPAARLMVPPVLDETGLVTFGVIADDGTGALFEAPLRSGGVSAAVRILDDGDPVQGGSLTPLEIQSFDRDALGLLALQAVFDSSLVFGSFLEEGGTLVSVAKRFDPVGLLGTVQAVRPRLAAAGEGRLVHGVLTFAGVDALLLREPSAPETPTAQGVRPGQGPGPGQDGEPTTSVLAATGLPAPDGGIYLAFQPISRTTARLASDGDGLLAIAARTDAGPEEIVWIDLDPNAPPAGNAGPDQIVECAGPAGTAVTLDGGHSSDPDGDLLTYVWTGPFGTVTGPTPTVTLPLGIHTLTLLVSDGAVESPPDTVMIEVRDTLPPGISVSAAPQRLWPPDGGFVQVDFSIILSDVCDPAPRVTLESVSIADPKGSNPATDIAGADIGSDDRSILLRARRSGGGDRIYTATYLATDASANAASGLASVVVPQSQGR